MIQITSTIAISESELKLEFIRASGPGGQNVNKVATAVKLRFDVKHSPSLPNEVRERVIRLAGRKINEAGVLIIDARRYRTQERNRQDAVARLIQLIRKAAEKPRTRRKTKPTKASKHRRLEAKRQRGDTKLLRRAVDKPAE